MMANLWWDAKADSDNIVANSTAAKRILVCKLLLDLYIERSHSLKETSYANKLVLVSLSKNFLRLF